MNEQQKDYVADRDMVDSLRLEVSSISPEHDRLMPVLADEVIRGLVSRYQDFIPPENTEQIQSLRERMLVTDHDTFLEFASSWDGAERSVQPQKIDGHFLHNGNIALIHDDKYLTYIWDFYSPDSKNALIMKIGNEDNARANVGLRRLFEVAVHEIVHGFHSVQVSLHHNLAENGVFYYTREVLGSLVSTSENHQADIYQSFLKVYSDEAHKVFFGSITDPFELSVICYKYTTFSNFLGERSL